MEEGEEEGGGGSAQLSLNEPGRYTEIRSN